MKQFHKILLGLIITLSLVVITLDCSRLFCYEGKFIDSYFLTMILKFATSFLCGFTVWTLGTQAYNQKDALHLKIAFIAVVLGDLCFFLSRYCELIGTLAVGVFAIGQILLTIRNSQGIVAFFKDSTQKDKHKRAYLAMVFWAFCTALLVSLCFYPVMGNTFLFYFMTLYAVFLCISVWTAWISRFTGYFLPTNAILITIGMVLFYCCDTTVGLGMGMGGEDNQWKDSFLRLVITSLTWIFYAPALILLVLSGFSYQKH